MRMSLREGTVLSSSIQLKWKFEVRKRTIFADIDCNQKLNNHSLETFWALLLLLWGNNISLAYSLTTNHCWVTAPSHQGCQCKHDSSTTEPSIMISNSTADLPGICQSPVFSSKTHSRLLGDKSRSTFLEHYLHVSKCVSGKMPFWISHFRFSGTFSDPY